MIRRMLVLLISASLLAACADPAGEPGADRGGEMPALEATCGAVLLEGGASPVLPTTPIDVAGEAAIESVYEVAAGEAQFFEEYEWFVGEATEERLVLFGTPLNETPQGAPPYANASFAREGDGWSPEGWGQCRIEVSAAGYGNAHWVLDPENEPQSGDTELAVLINERNCANGEPPVGRDIVPVVVEEPDTVMITVLVEPVSGGANCPSNPWHPMTVELTEPFGERTLFDGSSVPVLERTWPPSQTSLDSFGSEP